MPHFGIESLGHGLGGFIEGTTRDTGQTITGQISDLTASQRIPLIESFNNLQRFLAGGELPESFRQATVTENLLGLGQASIDISQALSEQVTIREDQLARTQEAIRNNQILQTNINEQFTKAFGDLTNTLGNIGQGGFDPIQFFTDNPLIGGIGIGGLAVGAVVLFLVLK